MLVKVPSVAFSGMDTTLVDVEVNISSRGLPSFDIVGLPNRAIAESKHRVKTAIKNSQIDFPNKKIVVNLAPADVYKDGSFYDFPIAAGILSIILSFKLDPKVILFGEVSLDGTLRYTKGALAVSLFIKEKGYKGLYVPYASMVQASAVRNVDVFGVRNLTEFVNIMNGTSRPLQSVPTINTNNKVPDKHHEIQIEDVFGHNEAKRALEISVSGGHNLLLTGTPGIGKSMLCHAAKSIQPSMSEDESIEVTKIYSLSGILNEDATLIKERPFRSPHHTISYSGMIGGGRIMNPGEITFAHKGILFMDEFSEFHRDVLESLRQPMETGTIQMSRGVFPAKFLLLATTNPCRCGNYGSLDKVCICTSSEVLKYQKKISLPILDRFSLFLRLNPISIEISKNTKSKLETSIYVKERVEKTVRVQRRRFKSSNIHSNSEIPSKDVNFFCKLNRDAASFLYKAIDVHKISTRGAVNILKVARTIADIDSSEVIEGGHILEAIHYRYKVLSTGY